MITPELFQSGWVRLGPIQVWPSQPHPSLDCPAAVTCSVNIAVARDRSLAVCAIGATCAKVDISDFYSLSHGARGMMAA
jgi:hypothetical protein